MWAAAAGVADVASDEVQAPVVVTTAATRAWAARIARSIAHVDEALAAGLAGTPRRWVVAGAGAREVGRMLAQIRGGIEDVVVVVGPVDIVEECVVRTVCLGVAGVCSGERAAGIVDGVVKAWAGGARAAWGEAAVGGGEGFVCPPGWDSEAKIRAVVDARGISGEVDAGCGEGEEVAPDRDADAAARALAAGVAEEAAWRARFATLLDEVRAERAKEGKENVRDPAVAVGNVAAAVSFDARARDKPGESLEYFQTLLSEKRP